MDKKPTLIGLYTSIGGYIAMPIIVLLLNSQLKGLWISIYLCSAPFFLVQVSSLTSSIRERFSVSGKAGLILSSIGIAAVLFYILHDYKVSGLFLFLSFLHLPSSVLLGIVSGIAAIKIARDKIVNKYKTMLILWCIPALGFIVFSMFSNSKAGLQNLTGLSVLCGPWATLTAKIGSWPNAGEFFSLRLAVIMTLSLILTIALIIKIKKTSAVAFLMVYFAFYVYIWELVGIVQLLNCAE
jgi:hypothetical protein